MQPCIEKGMYTIAYYIVAEEDNRRIWFNFDNRTFDTPEGLLLYIKENM